MIRTKTTRTRQEKNQPETFESAMQAYESSLLRYATRILGDTNTAQDIVQDTFIKLFKAWNNGQHPKVNLKGWLYRVTHNQAVDHIRRESRLRVLHEEQAETLEADPSPPSPSGTLSRKDTLATVLTYVQELAEMEQMVVLLRLQEGMSYKDIGNVIGRTEGSVGSTLHYAVKKLAGKLKQAGIVEGGSA